MNLLIFGSSITWGAWDEQGGWAQRLKTLADHKAIAEDLDSYTAVYCLGVSGDDTKDLLVRFNTELSARISEDEETTVLIEIGINDSQFVLAEDHHRMPQEAYRQNLITLITQAQEHNASVILIGLTPVDDSKVDPIPWAPDRSYRQAFVDAYDAVIKQVAAEQSIPFIELMPPFLGADYKRLLVDGVHPNTEGHELIYRQISTYLKTHKII